MINIGSMIKKDKSIKIKIFLNSMSDAAKPAENKEVPAK